MDPHRKPKPSAAPPISMPPKPINPTIDLKKRAVNPPHQPKASVADPSVMMAPTPPSRVDDIDAFESYRESYDEEFPDALPTAPRPAQGTAAEWVEVKTRPNHHHGIINLDYATVVQSHAVNEQASQVKESLNRTNTKGPCANLVRPADPTRPSSPLFRQEGLRTDVTVA
jgi:hypothetical protein